MTHHYGQPLNVKVKDGVLTIEIGVHVLAQATQYAEWANRYDDEAGDYFRHFAITAPIKLAKDVGLAMLREREDGSSPLTVFLDAMTEAALDDGTLGVEFEQRIKTGEASPLETWASRGGTA